MTTEKAERPLSKFAWLDSDVAPILADQRRIEGEIRDQMEAVRATADALAGVPDVPHADLIRALKNLRSIGISLECLAEEVGTSRGEVQGFRDGIDERFDDIMEALALVVKDAKIAEAQAETDRLVNVIRERMDRRLRLAAIQEEKGGEPMYVKVSRLFAAELEEILAEAGVTPGKTR